MIVDNSPSHQRRGSRRSRGRGRIVGHSETGPKRCLAEKRIRGVRLSKISTVRRRLPEADFGGARAATSTEWAFLGQVKKPMFPNGSLAGPLHDARWSRPPRG